MLHDGITGVPASADVVLRTSFLSIATWLNSQHASSTSELLEGPQAMDTDSAAEPTAKAAADSSANGDEASEQSAAQDEIIKKLMQDLVFHSRAEVQAFLESIILCTLLCMQMMHPLYCSKKRPFVCVATARETGSELHKIWLDHCTHYCCANRV